MFKKLLSSVVKWFLNEDTQKTIFMSIAKSLVKSTDNKLDDTIVQVLDEVIIQNKTVEFLGKTVKDL